MHILPTLLAAFNGAGRSKAAIARGAGVTTQTLRAYMSGDQLIPEHRRARLAEAFGRAIDWPQYCADFREAERAAQAQKTPVQRIQAAGMSPRPAAPPAKAPAPAPKAPAAIAKPAPTPKPAAAPEKPVRRLFGFIPIIEDEED